MPHEQQRKLDPIESKGLLHRSYVIDQRSIDEEARTVELTFSSETREVERWFGLEILDHSTNAVRLKRMQAGGPLLFIHDMRQHLGVCEDISIEKRKGKALDALRSQLAGRRESSRTSKTKSWSTSPSATGCTRWYWKSVAMTAHRTSIARSTGNHMRSACYP
ncbi:hypothetical protein [Thiohalophilus sp.]|uniref:hypothetical protein n=1 Tax=Thiohalophilus sp. TaxID=3028392 RepID=UPI002ACE2D5A|nr:hypothetical protein [Thiohalophilus sp.]MDZ7804326.1 hypothetical protein [Thiohalophilus sp.]